MEPLYRTIKTQHFDACRKGYTNKDAAFESGIRVATVERFYHQMVALKIKHQQSQQCPRILGIVEHRLSRKTGFVTTFCNLEKHSVFDVAHNYELSCAMDYAVSEQVTVGVSFLFSEGLSDEAHDAIDSEMLSGATVTFAF